MKIKELKNKAFHYALKYAEHQVELNIGVENDPDWEKEKKELIEFINELKEYIKNKNKESL